jgi:hypothetical protein
MLTRHRARRASRCVLRPRRSRECSESPSAPVRKGVLICRPFTTALCLAVTAELIACSSADSKSGSCVDLSGSWAIVEHCQNAYRGRTTTLDGDDCEFSVTDPVSRQTYDASRSPRSSPARALRLGR